MSVIKDGSNIVCPMCAREYELPRRFLVRADDIEFLAVPRLLGCLHTCCQSCLEEMWQKSNFANGISLRSTMQSGSVTCPQCDYKQIVDKGVQYLPFDGVAISEIIPLNGTNLSFCSRCHDEVPSYSWCSACSVTLCEFHHQDHKLSINTSRHEVKTFKDISRSNITIEPRMPVIPCPQEMEQDASLYCEECCKLFSPKAMMSSDHKHHSCQDAKSLAEDAVRSIEGSMKLLEDREKGLVNAMKTINDNIKLVKSEMSNSMKDIEVIFAKIHEDLEYREHALLQRLDDIATRKTKILSDQLLEMDDAIEKCRHALDVAGDILEKSAEKVVPGGGLYVLGASSIVSNRRDELDEIIVNIHFEPQVDPYIRASFVKDEVETIHSVLLSLGSILTKDNTPSVDDLEMRSPRVDEDDGDQEEKMELDRVTNASEDKATVVFGKSKIVDKKGRFTYSALPKKKLGNEASDMKFSFTIKTEDPPVLSNLNKSTFSKEAVIIQARMLRSDHHVEEAKPEDISKSVEEVYGPVVGEVVVLTEIDKRYLKRHIVRSNYESFVGDTDDMPVLRLTREIMTCV